MVIPIASRYAGALKATGNSGLQPAMDHIIDNQDKPVPDLSSVSESARSAPPPSEGMDVDGDDEELAALKAVYGKGGGAGEGEGSSGAAEGAEAKSIKCSVCGKTFKNVDLANYHAEKSGHDQFEESTEEVCGLFLGVLSVPCIPLHGCLHPQPLDLTRTLALCSNGARRRSALSLPSLYPTFYGCGLSGLISGCPLHVTRRQGTSDASKLFHVSCTHASAVCEHSSADSVLGSSYPVEW